MNIFDNLCVEYADKGLIKVTLYRDKSDDSILNIDITLRKSGRQYEFVSREESVRGIREKTMEVDEACAFLRDIVSKDETYTEVLIHNEEVVEWNNYSEPVPGLLRILKAPK